MDLALAAGAVAVAVFVYLKLRPKPRAAHVPEQFFTGVQTPDDEEIELADEHDDQPTQPESEADDQPTQPESEAIENDDSVAATHGTVDDQEPQDLTADRVESEDDDHAPPTVSGAANPETDADRWGFQTIFGLTEDKASALRSRIEAELANADGRRRMMESLEAELASRQATNEPLAATSNGQSPTAGIGGGGDGRTEGGELQSQSDSDTEDDVRNAVSLLKHAAVEDPGNAEQLSADTTDALASAFAKLTERRST